MLEACHADFRERINMDQLAASSFRAFERRQHARMVRARILTNDKDRVRFVEVFERDSSLPDTNRFAQRRAARLVTHVRTIRQVVGAELTHKELIQKSRLVAGAAGSVEDGLRSEEHTSELQSPYV